MRIITVLLSVVLLCVVTGDAIAQTDPNAVYRMDMSADGTRFATSNVRGLTLYDAEFNPLNFRAYTSEQDYLYTSPLFSPDGTRILVRNEIWDSNTLETMTTLPLDKVIEPQWSADSQMILTWPRTTQIHSAQDGRLIRELTYEQRWSATNAYFTRVVGEQIIVTDATTDVEVGVYTFAGQNLGWAIWNADDTRFAISAFATVEPGTPNSRPTSSTQALLYSLFVVDMPSGRITQLENVSSGAFFVWRADGQHLAGRTNESRLYVWDTTNGAVVESYALPPEKFITMLKYSPTGGRLVAGLVDRSVPPNLTDTTLRPSSTFSQTQLDGALQIFAPAATPERLQSILSECSSDDRLQSAADTLIEAGQYQEFIARLDANTAVSTSCAADLRLMAQALASEAVSAP
jgi:dipeptidyl aminopeptidase/acylaminoacyl peptidase